MITLDNLVVTTALPSIRLDLGASIEGLEWTVNAYTLSFAVLLLPAAALGDRFGRRRVFIAGLALFTAASALAALAPSAGALMAARAIQGAGGAIIAPLSLTLLADAVPAGRRGLALGAWSGISRLGVALGPGIGGAGRPSARGGASAACRRRSGRSSAARSSTGRGGRGSSGSTSRSASPCSS